MHIAGLVRLHSNTRTAQRTPAQHGRNQQEKGSETGQSQRDTAVADLLCICSFIKLAARPATGDGCCVSEGCD